MEQTASSIYEIKKKEPNERKNDIQCAFIHLYIFIMKIVNKAYVVALYAHAV